MQSGQANGCIAIGQVRLWKTCVSRHGQRMTIRGANACEKAIETKTRQQGKAQCREVEG